MSTSTPTLTRSFSFCNKGATAHHGATQEDHEKLHIKKGGLKILNIDGALTVEERSTGDNPEIKISEFQANQFTVTFDKDMRSAPIVIQDNLDNNNVVKFADGFPNQMKGFMISAFTARHLGYQPK